MLRHGRRHLEPRCSRVRSIAAMVLLWWSTSRVLFHIVNQSITTESITSQPLVMVSSDISTSFRSSTASEVTTEGGIEMRLLLLLLLLLSSLCITHHAVRSIRNTHGKRGHHSPLTVVTLLMLCGDIECNPGPNTYQVYPCGICDRKVKWEDKGVACDSCNIWFHCS